KAFAQADALARHARKHTDERPFVCRLCPVSFRQKCHLKAHVDVEHDGCRPFKCDRCPKAFLQRSWLTKHRRVHAGMHIYKCTSCSLD
ncbi:zinc finger protein, putative, partial [Ixodes scapularis]